MKFKFGQTGGAPKFQNPEEEIAYLRAQLADREAAQANESAPGAPEKSKETLAHEIISEYKQVPQESVIPKERIVQHDEAVGIVLRLTPEPHDDKIAGLYSVMLEKGIKNTLAI